MKEVKQVNGAVDISKCNRKITPTGKPKHWDCIVLSYQEREPYQTYLPTCKFPPLPLSRSSKLTH